MRNLINLLYKLFPSLLFMRIKQGKYNPGTGQNMPWSKYVCTWCENEYIKERDGFMYDWWCRSKKACPCQRFHHSWTNHPASRISARTMRKAHKRANHIRVLADQHIRVRVRKREIIMGFYSISAILLDLGGKWAINRLMKNHGFTCVETRLVFSIVPR